MDEYKSLSINPLSKPNTAITNANSPSAAMLNPTTKTSRRCKPVNRALVEKLGTRNPTASFPSSASVNNNPWTIIFMSAKSLTGT
mmetsp:Transcript_11127/g.13601  ORF Transcript_11127/g.13601 Transcript_11127/m.13601 type:complete len:85 (+) Transcript_11127:616-870(+)